MRKAITENSIGICDFSLMIFRFSPSNSSCDGENEERASEESRKRALRSVICNHEIAHRQHSLKH